MAKCEVPGCDNPTDLGICDDCDQWVTDMVAADRGVPPIIAEINNAIAAWHDGAGGDKSLHDFLGWSFEEYAAWVSDEHAIPDRALACTSTP